MHVLEIQVTQTEAAFQPSIKQYHQVFTLVLGKKLKSKAARS